MRSKERIWSLAPFMIHLLLLGAGPPALAATMISGNGAYNEYGGGIYCDRGTLSLKHCTTTGNHAARNAAIHSDRTRSWG